ncbi:hypothetical protein WK78_29025 [Burkholderia cepacia]|nr:hypothetical protein WK78_29025 [Burkholderia cepacia]
MLSAAGQKELYDRSPSEPAAQAAAPIDIEAMLCACVPGGDICDPQRVADSIREWFAELGVQADAPAEAREPKRIGTVEITDGRVRGYTFEQTDTPTGSYGLYTGPVSAGADAGEVREPLNEVLFGNDEALEMAADALDRLGEDSGAAGVRAVAYELRLLAHKARCAPADAGEARLTDEQIRAAIDTTIAENGTGELLFTLARVIERTLNGADRAD